MSAKWKCGQEPFLKVLVNDDNNVNNVSVVGDTVHLCETNNMKDRFLLLLSFYFVMNLNYPAEYAQFLGLLQVLCLCIDFLQKLRSASFHRFCETIAF